MQRPTRILLATMAIGFVSGHCSLITASAVAFLALRYAYEAGYRDARESEGEKYRKEDEELEEERLHKSGTSEDWENEDVGRTASGPEFEDRIADEIILQTSDCEVVIAAMDNLSARRDSSLEHEHEHQEKGAEGEREDEEISLHKCAVTGRARRASRVVERTIYELGMDAKCEVADWGVDPE